MEVYGDCRDYMFPILLSQYFRQEWNKCGETSEEVGHAAFENTPSSSRIRKRPYFLRKPVPAFDSSIPRAQLGRP